MTIMRKNKGWVAAGVALMLLAAGYAAGAAQAGTVTVSMKDRQFAPDVLTIKVGDSVEWLNDDQDVHQVISGKDLSDPAKLGKPLDGGTLMPGQKYVYTFSTPGRYPYMCVIHWSLQSISGKGGMVGEVVVEP
jgi:plastocyanin